MRVRAIQEFDVEQMARALRALPGFAWLDARYDTTTDGRYSFLATAPVEQVTVPFGDEPFQFADAAAEDEPFEGYVGELSVAHVPRWIGYIAYDAAWSRPVRGEPRFDRGAMPIVCFNRYDAVLVVDHERDQAHVVGDTDGACDRLLTTAQQPATNLAPASIGSVDVDDARDHRYAIERALNHIREGDIYQVNLARRWRASFDGDPLSLWSAMRQASGVPLGLFMDADDHFVLAATMERFLRWTTGDRRLVTRPIKGTIHRDSSHDHADTLREDPKERAEHSMIVDLMRNDLGRVATIGSVRVDEALKVEPFTGLYHLVSTVSCETRPEIAAKEILDATFPPGSVTGTPKVRAVEVIEELEQHPRGIYCGACGFFDRSGGLSLAVAIRTATVRSGSVEYWAGGGIVEASDPDKELAETELKARVFLEATAASESASS